MYFKLLTDYIPEKYLLYFPFSLYLLTIVIIITIFNKYICIILIFIVFGISIFDIYKFQKKIKLTNIEKMEIDILNHLTEIDKKHDEFTSTINSSYTQSELKSLEK